MKATRTKELLLLMLLLLGVVLGREAQASYNPSTGRWLSRDRIGERGGKNLYGFVRNNPARYWDHLGRCVNTTGGKKAFGGGFRFDAGANFADVTVQIEDKDYCESDSMNLVFNFYSDSDDASDRELKDSAEFTCNGEKTSPSTVTDPPVDGGDGSRTSGKVWSVTCKLALTKCHSTAAGVILGMKGVLAPGKPMEDVGEVQASIQYSCDCPCKINGCVNVSLTAKGNR